MERGLEKRAQREARAVARAAKQAERRYARAVRRREGRLRRARTRLPRHGAVAVAAGLLAGPVLGDGGLELALALTAGLTGAVAARSAWLLHRPPPLPEPPAALPPPPQPGSAAWPYLVRLEAVREQVVQLVPLVDPAGQEAAREAREAAEQADRALRWQAARLAAVEPHRGADPLLLRLLSDGVAAQERVVAALCDLVAASAPGGPAADLSSASHRLQDAADRLHGLADGLRVVR